MSTPLGSSQLFVSRSFYPHPIDQSLRFENGDTASMSRTNSGAGNRRTWTFSAWIKRSNLGSGTQNYILGATTDNYSANWAIFFLGSDELTFYSYTSSQQYQINTGDNGVFRDPSAWYHIVLAWDTTQSTAADRIKLYVNGSQFTNFETAVYPSLNYEEGYINNNIQQDIGRAATAAYGYDGYMAEVHFVDGSALAPTSFGETKSGIWIPKKYTGSHGTNGYHLDFADGSALGDDESGNNNDFTPTGLAATDVVLDSPTNNWATMNPLDPPVGTSVTLSEGNLKATGSTSSYSGGVASTFEFESGKWYWEVYINNEVDAGSNYYSFVGAATGENNEVHRTNVSNVPSVATGVDGWSWEGDGKINLIGTGTRAVTSVSAPSAGDILGFAMDLDNGNVYFYLNGTAQNSGSAVITGVTGLKTNPMVGVYNSSAVTFNFGQDSSFAGTKTAQGNTDRNGNGDFYYTPPSFYLACCSASLPDPDIDPAIDQSPTDHFNTVLYSGTGSTRTVTGVGFQPDFVWIKDRTTAYDHHLFDVVRGGENSLYSNDSVAENTYPTDITFTSDGFSIADGSAVPQIYINKSSDAFVSWNWLAGGSASSNSNGSITSSVSANTEAGFSIVSYTGNGSAGATVGHGLTNAPEFFVTKRRSQSDPWQTYVASLGATKRLELDATSGAITSTASFNDTEPNSSVFTLGSGGYGNASSATYIAYCFHSVDGYSKVGSYSANNSSDGPFVYLGFRPAFIFIKGTSTTTHWVISDNKRDGVNVTSKALFSNLSNSESTDRHVDFLSNGFKLRLTALDPNTNGTDYIYLAFAEQPFKYSNAR
tara:strand:- start:2117 stop:4582 length:2466 start_codon:yes stop_codon:yes gene_type:complete